MTARKLVLCAFVLFLVPLAAFAQVGKTWTVSGSEAFSKGKLDGASVLSTGEMVLGPAVEQIKGLKANYVWDLAVGKDGAVYVATGSPAVVYVLREGELKEIHKTSDKHVLSVLPLPDGAVLAATAPRGIVYKIDGEQNVTVFRELEKTYVWDMALGPNGEIYCATGPNGKLIQLSATGEPKEVFKAKQSHLMCLAVDPDGGIFAGTEPDGLIYRIEPGGKASVLYDTDETEVHCLLLAPDGVLFAGTAQTQGRPAGSGAPSSMPSVGPQPGGGPPSLGEMAAPTLPGRPSTPNSLYKILAGEGAVRLARLPNTVVLSLAITEGLDVLVGTATEGRLVSVDAEGVQRIITDFKASHISAMAPDSQGAVIVGTSNTGGLWRLQAGYREAGTFTSDVFDAGYLARWGRIWWKGAQPTGTGVTASLRTGNSRKPDDTWSDWSAPAEGAAGRAVEVPMGRFAQLKVEMRTGGTGETPMLIAVSASYRQINRRPDVQKLAVEGGASAPGASRPGPSSTGRQTPGKRSITWQAKDPNGDPIVVDLYYRGVAQRQWKTLEKDIKAKTKYDWDIRRVPDGLYVLRLVASDRLGRPADEALQAEKLTAPFVIDNRSPAVLDLQAEVGQDKSYVITGVAKDSYSTIKAIQVSRNSEDWEPVFPADGIFDSTAEEFSFRTDSLAQGEHVFVFAATDKAGNLGSEQIIILVK